VTWFTSFKTLDLMIAEQEFLAPTANRAESRQTDDVSPIDRSGARRTGQPDRNHL
jgi:hypothetical protein